MLTVSRRSFIVLLGLLLAVVPASGQDPARAAVVDFAWLEGHWESELDGRAIETHWSAPRAGTMIGMFRISEGERLLMVELFTLIETGDRVVMFLRHFSPELVPWEEKDAAIRLELDSYDGRRAVFNNPIHTRPKQTVLTRLDTDTFHARSEIIRQDGSKSVIDVTWRRATKPRALPAASQPMQWSEALPSGVSGGVRITSRIDGRNLATEERKSWQK
jgi:hypothetical protein